MKENNWECPQCKANLRRENGYLISEGKEKTKSKHNVWVCPVCKTDIVRRNGIMSIK